MEKVKPNKLYHCTYLLSYHFVFVTKYRRRCLTPAMLERLREIVAEMVSGYGQLVEMKGEADHIHLLLDLNPKVAPSVVANSLKTVTSRLLRRDFGEHLDKVYRKPVLWSRSYFVASCGTSTSLCGTGAPLSVIKQYIEQQHRPE